jgi:hypothetical protein
VFIYARNTDALEKLLAFRHWQVFEYTHSLGIPLPTMDLWPLKVSRKLYHTLQELKIEAGAGRLTLPLYDTWKHMSRQTLRMLWILE